MLSNAKDMVRGQKAEGVGWGGVGEGGEGAKGEPASMPLFREHLPFAHEREFPIGWNMTAVIWVLFEYFSRLNMASVEVNKWISEALFDLKTFSGLTRRQKQIRSRQKQMAHGKTKSTQCDIFIADVSLFCFDRNVVTLHWRASVYTVFSIDPRFAS